MSKIIVIEGPDRCGKATQSKLLRDRLASFGVASTIVEVPVRSAVTYRIIYWMLQNGLAKKFPKLFQVLQFLNRKIFQILDLPGLENEYDVIIFDRWSLSSIVYGEASGVSKDFTIKLSKHLRQPDHTFILLGHSFPHDAEDVYESDVNLQEDVRIRYSLWAANHPHVTTVIDCQQNKKKISKQIREVLEMKKIIKSFR
jgi:dTMP kinase